MMNYAWLLRRTGRRGGAGKLEVDAREIAATYRSQGGRFSVDVTDLVSSK